MQDGGLSALHVLIHSVFKTTIYNGCYYYYCCCCCYFHFPEVVTERD